MEAAGIADLATLGWELPTCWRGQRQSSWCPERPEEMRTPLPLRGKILGIRSAETWALLGVVTAVLGVHYLFRTAPMCLNRHGAVDSMEPEVRQLLSERYPDDRATGYEAGELRGVIRAEVPQG